MYETETERAELRGFVIEVGRTLQSHAVALHRHEENFKGAFKATESHHDCIVSLRKDVEGLAELVNAQSRLITAMQGVLLKIVSKLGLEPPELPPTAGAPN